MLSKILIKIKIILLQMLLYVIENENYVWFTVFNVIFIALRIYCFFCEINFSVGAYIFEIVSDLSNVIVAGVLNIEAFAQTKWDFTTRHHNLPTFLLCILSNISSMIIWWRSWSYDGMENIDSSNSSPMAIMLSLMIVITAMYTYLDGVFIYHKMRKTEDEIYDHIVIVMSFVTAASNILFFVSAIYFIIFSNNVLVHIFTGIFLMSTIGFLYEDFGFEPQIGNEVIQRLLVFFCTDFRLYCAIVLLICSVKHLWIDYFYDKEAAQQLILPAKSIIGLYLSGFFLHFFATTVRSICLLKRILRNVLGNMCVGYDSDIDWRCRG